MLLESGANIKDIQIRLGHSKLATTMDVYVHSQKTLIIFSPSNPHSSVQLQKSLVTFSP